ncbi:trimeric intracellular cation channel family protein [Isoptericola sp. b441]|uniref:Trimeric intracellular cation channel family protein n=1 Tax=Actinotalea lenta TaxID=3064654 RepID=A0ABT9DER8_9CELL|nr:MULTISPECIES: trimeric intracellular cation channel family protein [unclassified Isoptericola]MDO8108013.1 trimeric intracellular cation channel family protein [Isoptericola sp. b441]MDO8120317.1 trimeric intracellular cation channel family protein [Isoptericola sp. b490]
MSEHQILFTLDILGTLTFALNGALTASRRVRLDIVGVLTLGVVTAVGGGMTRDVLLGDTPPDALKHWYYLATALGGAAIAWFIARPPRALARTIVVFDAIGLSVFAVAGAQKAVGLGLNPAPAILLGAITAVGGGTIRDVLIREVPSVLTSDLYAIPALIGAATAVLGGAAGLAPFPAAALGAILCFGIRMAGVRYRLQAPSHPPRAPEPPTSRQA